MPRQKNTLTRRASVAGHVPVHRLPSALALSAQLGIIRTFSWGLPAYRDRPTIGELAFKGSWIYAFQLENNVIAADHDL